MKADLGAIVSRVRKKGMVSDKRRPRFEVYKAKDGHRWRLIAANGRIIATGEAHTRERDAERAIETVREAVQRSVK